MKIFHGKQDCTTKDAIVQDGLDEEEKEKRWTLDLSSQISMNKIVIQDKSNIELIKSDRDKDNHVMPTAS